MKLFGLLFLLLDHPVHLRPYHMCCIVTGSRATCPQSAELQYMYDVLSELLVSVVLYHLQVS